MKCGHIIMSEENILIEDEMYVDWLCNKCGHERLLYLCDNVDDIEIYKDVFLDVRYFDYSKNNTKL